MIEIKWTEGEGPGFGDAAKVRMAVFCDEQGFTVEFDGRDHDAWHLVGYQEGRPVSAARIYWVEEGLMRFGRIAVLKAGRGLGLGSRMIDAMKEKARGLGAKKAVLDAQADKQAFYEKNGFAPTGVETLDEGVPHVEMSADL